MITKYIKLVPPVHSGCEEDRDLGGAPASPGQSGGARLHPHDGGGLQVLDQRKLVILIKRGVSHLTPDLGRGVSDSQEVLGVKGIPVHSHHFALVTPWIFSQSESEDSNHSSNCSQFSITH